MRCVAENAQARQPRRRTLFLTGALCILTAVALQGCGGGGGRPNPSKVEKLAEKEEGEKLEKLEEEEEEEKEEKKKLKDNEKDIKKEKAKLKADLKKEGGKVDKEDEKALEEADSDEEKRYVRNMMGKKKALTYEEFVQKYGEKKAEKEWEKAKKADEASAGSLLQLSERQLRWQRAHSSIAQMLGSMMSSTEHHGHRMRGPALHARPTAQAGGRGAADAAAHLAEAPAGTLRP
mmetsp:Transcript_153465/g.282455  ORF Transcript_153465/g.282455 Transcript_153465/m.282455 type:complete len:234 (+) Transcript_153465:102-803(+)